MASEFDGWESWEKEQREKAEQEAEIKNIVRKMMFESLTNGFRQMVRELVAEEVYKMMPIIKAQLRFVEEVHSGTATKEESSHTANEWRDYDG